MLKYLRFIMLGMMAFGSLCVGTMARAEWWEAETSHFVIISESSEADAQLFALRLERFDNALRFLQGLPIPGPDIGQSNKVRVYRFGDPYDIGELAYSGGGRSGIGGFYVGRAGASVAFVPTKADDSLRFDRDLERRGRAEQSSLTPEGTLFHEYVHHFMLQRFNTTYPHWYVEGFAELYATIELLDGGAFRVGNVPQHRASDLINLGDVKLTKLLDHSKKLSPTETYQSYSFGWMLAHYLNFSKERQGQLRDYLKALNAGEPSLAAATRVFGDLDKLQKELQTYRKGPFPGYEVKPANYVAPVVKMRRLTTGEEAVIEGHIRSERGVDKSRARAVVSSVGGKELTYPDNLAVQLIAAEAYSDARMFDKAEATLKRALAIDPDSQKAHVLMGALISARADADKNPALYTTARQWFADAVRLDPKDPRAAMGFYMTYYEAREPIPETAIITLEDVFEQSSHDNSYRMILARQLLDENKGKAARSVLAPLAFSAHKQDEANKIAKIVEEIDADRVEEARTLVAALFAEAKRDANK